MTTARHAAPTPGERQRRRRRRRRIVREELLAVAVLAAILVVTLILIGLQWLDAGSSSSAAGPAGIAHLHALSRFLEAPA